VQEMCIWREECCCFHVCSSIMHFDGLIVNDIDSLVVGVIKAIQ